MTATAEPEADQRTVRSVRTVLEKPLVSFGLEITSNLSAALRREWLVTTAWAATPPAASPA
jgi:hypothetical protein